jgi:hypothetical protein
MGMNKIFACLGLLALVGCSTSSAPSIDETGSRQIQSNAVLYQGPEIAATLVYPSGDKSIGEEWLVLAAEVTAAQGAGPVILKGDEISLRTPDGRRLVMAGQNQFRSTYPRFSIPVERTLAYLPLLNRYAYGREVPCNRWFLVPPPGLQAFDEIPLSVTQICSGPLVFSVPGGVQPGRWRLIIELEESTADIPFELALEQ